MPFISKNFNDTSTTNNLFEIDCIEKKRIDLKKEEAAISAKNLEAAGTFQQLSHGISEEYKILDRYRSSCKEELLELGKLQLQKEKLESVVKEFCDNNESLHRIKEVVRQIIEQRLMNRRHVLLIALQSIIDSCRRDPVKFNILYYNLSTAAITTIDTRLAEFDMSEQYNYGLSTNDQLYYQHENANDDVAYSKVLVNVAEQFFNRMIKEMEQVCVNRIIEAFIPDSLSSQLTKKSLLDSKAVLPIQQYWNKNEDPL
jgi:hypothetical protein